MKSLMSKLAVMVAFVAILSSCTDCEEVIVDLEDRTEVLRKDGDTPPPPIVVDPILLEETKDRTSEDLK